MDTSELQLAAIAYMVFLGICLFFAMKVFRYRKNVQSWIMLGILIVTVLTSPLALWITVVLGVKWVLPWGASALLCKMYYYHFVDPQPDFWNRSR